MGVSEFTFPGATHTRFSHCIGVFHVARRLLEVATRFLPAAEQNEYRARVAAIAALLHDLGHGPLSHAFEEAEKTRLRHRPGAYRSHEAWTAEIIRRGNGKIRGVLAKHFGGGMADDVAELLLSEPTDIYAAVVSSSFDADRLDYLRRDKHMTGSGAGGIDFDWLIDNLRVTTIESDGEGDLFEDDPLPIKTFCFAEKAAQAAEAFILARYHLYSQVYFHRTTRGIEQLLAAFLRAVAEVVGSGKIDELCLRDDHPLVAYYASDDPSIGGYLALDDTCVWSAVEAASRGKNASVKELALRLRDRRRLKAIEFTAESPTATDRARRDFIETKLGAQINRRIFFDRAPLTVYGGIKAGEAGPHKRVRILRTGEQRAVDITSVSKAIAALTEKQEVLRYYFLDDATWDQVAEIRVSA